MFKALMNKVRGRHEIVHTDNAPKPYPNQYTVKVYIKMSATRIAKWEMKTHAKDKDHAQQIVRDFVQKNVAVEYKVHALKGG
jgi:hypothetical protein